MPGRDGHNSDEASVGAGSYEVTSLVPDRPQLASPGSGPATSTSPRQGTRKRGAGFTPSQTSAPPLPAHIFTVSRRLRSWFESQPDGVSAVLVPLCGFVTTSSDPATEFGDGVLLVCRSSRLRRCWHPVAFSGQVGAAPAARTLLGTQVVLWRTPDGRLHSAVDRCPHRWAQLSKGTVTDGRLVCPYHGWQFGPDGAVVEIPQLEAGAPLPQPPAPIPTIPEFEDPGFDRIEVGVIRYHASAAAIIDNNTDSTHVAFVHSGSFGADQDPRVPVGSVQRSSLGITINTGEMPVARTPTSQQPGTRHSVTEMWLPFVQVGRMHYSDGSTHILVKGCCPVQDGVTDVHLTVLRNDLAGSIDRQSVIDFELAVELEDKAVLETLPATFPLDPRLQAHTKHDRPGIAYRHALTDFLADPN